MQLMHSSSVFLSNTTYYEINSNQNSPLRNRIDVHIRPQRGKFFNYQKRSC